MFKDELKRENLSQSRTRQVKPSGPLSQNIVGLELTNTFGPIKLISGHKSPPPTLNTPAVYTGRLRRSL